MPFGRRSKVRLTEVELTPPPDEHVRVIKADAFDAAGAVGRIERFVAAANASMLQLEERIGRMETTVAALAEDLSDRPQHTDVLEVRLQAARLDSDLKRLGVELRGEIDEIKDVADARPSERRHHAG
jgi:phage shock protein A